MGNLMDAGPALLTLGEAGDRLHVQHWKIRRLHERKLIELPRAGRNYVVREDCLPKIEQALKLHGYIKAPTTAAAPLAAVPA